MRPVFLRIAAATTSVKWVRKQVAACSRCPVFTPHGVTCESNLKFKDSDSGGNRVDPNPRIRPMPPRGSNTSWPCHNTRSFQFFVGRPKAPRCRRRSQTWRSTVSKAVRVLSFARQGKGRPAPTRSLWPKGRHRRDIQLFECAEVCERQLDRRLFESMASRYRSFHP